MIGEREWQAMVAEVEASKTAIARLIAERDQALASAAAAAMEMRERAAGFCDEASKYYISDPENRETVDVVTEQIRALPIDPDAQKALDKLLAKAREDAIRAAASVCSKISLRYWSEWKDEANMLSQGASDGADECDAAILALINDGGQP